MNAPGEPMKGSNGPLTLDQLLAIHPLVSGDVPRWSPDGCRIAFTASIGGNPDLWSVGPDGGFPSRLTLGMGGVRFLASYMPSWSPDGRYLSYVSQKSGSDEVWLWPANGDAEFQLTRLGGNVHSMTWAPDSRAIILSNSRHGSYDIYRVEVPSGETTRLTKDRRYEVNPVFTPDGSQIVYVRLDETWEDHQIVKMKCDGSGPTVILEDFDFFDYTYGGSIGYPLVSPGGGTVLFRSQRSGHVNIWKASLDGGEPEPLAPEEAEQSDPAWSPDGRQVAYVSNHNGTLHLRIAGANGEAPRTRLAPEMGTCSVPQWSPDGKQISFLYGTPTTPKDLWVVPALNGPARQLTYSLPGGDLHERLATPEKITYESFDGLPISAYLYRPGDTDGGRRHPGILFIHGGPTSQFVDDLQPQVQYLVQRGYAVLLPNIRGSSGYGKEFEEGNDRDWGHGDLKDVIAGAEFLKRLDYVDSEKLGITGTSYGGIMSMCAVSFAPGFFQAAAPMSGYGDWPNLRHELELRHIKLLEHELGRYEENEQVWRRSSPIYAVANATTPCFVLHGVGQPPQSNASKAFVEALEQHYKTVRYKTYPNEGYYVRSTQNVRQMLLDLADFFDVYLRDGKPAHGGANDRP